MCKQTKQWRRVVWFASLVALAAVLTGCFDLSERETGTIPTDSFLAEQDIGTTSFDSPLATPTMEATPYILATPTTPPFPTSLPTPVVTLFPTAQPPIVPLPSEPAAKPFTIVFPDGNVIRAINSDGTDERVLIDIRAQVPLFLASDDERVKVNERDCGSISPDGRRLALVLSNVESWESLPKGEPAEFSIHLFDLATGDLRLLVQDGVEPVWSPGGDRIAYRSTKTSGLWIVDVNTGETSEIYVVDQKDEHFVNDINWSPDGKRLVFLDHVFRQSTTIMVADANVAEPARVLVPWEGGYWLHSPAWSPDGNKILFVSLAGKSSSSNYFYNLWIMNSDGTNQTQLTQDTTVGTPQWSPDGSWIAFDGSLAYEGSESRHELWLVRPNGSERKRLTSDAVVKAGESDPVWSPDGTRILFTLASGQVCMLSLADGVQTKLPGITANFLVAR